MRRCAMGLSAAETTKAENAREGEIVSDIEQLCIQEAIQALREALQTTVGMSMYAESRVRRAIVLLEMSTQK
jgi:hypothetical protein